MKRKIELEKLDEDGYASLYVFNIDGGDYEYFKYYSEFENDKKVNWDFDVIDQRIEKILENGAEDEHFRKEGKAVKALPIETSILRLYCYRISPKILILGNGGLKPRNRKEPEKNKTQNFPILNKYCETIRLIGDEIKAQIKSGKVTKRGNELIGLKPFTIDIPDD